MSDNVIYGRHPIWEALHAGRSFDKILVQKGIGGDIVREVVQLARQHEIPLQIVPPETLGRLSKGKNHQGMLGFTSLIDYYEIEDILANTYEKGQVPLFLLCDGITDVGNFGAIARTAACAGVQTIVIPAKGSAAINAETLKASAGALEKIHVSKVRFLDKTIRYLRENGVQIIATGLQTDTYIYQLDFTQPTAIIMGAEGKGVSPVFLKTADHIAQIPIPGAFDSYNVSVATGIVLYEAVRQRRII